MGTVVRHFELTDTEWERLQPYFLDRQAGDNGSPRKDSRQILNGILWIRAVILRREICWSDTGRALCSVAGSRASGAHLP